MARERLTVKGMPELQRALHEASAETVKAAELAVAQEVDAIQDDAVRFAPRDTGDLENHIDGAAYGLRGTVRSTSRHAGFVEHGTRHTRAQPYMLPAAELARRRLPKRAAAIIKAALGRVK